MEVSILIRALNILKKIKPNVDFEKTDNLVDGGILDSIDVIKLVVELNNTYGINISAGEITPENMNSYKALSDLVKRLIKKDDDNNCLG